MNLALLAYLVGCLWLPGTWAQQPQQAPLFRINMGGPTLIDGQWQGFQDESSSVPGFQVTTSRYRSTENEEHPVKTLPEGDEFTNDLFNTELFSRRDLNFEFTVPANANYQVVLYFMESFYDEIISESAPRKMQVVVNNQQPVAVEPFTRGGGFRKASKYATTVVTDKSQRVTVRLVAVEKEPSINAVELVPIDLQGVLAKAQSVVDDDTVNDQTLGLNQHQLENAADNAKKDLSPEETQGNQPSDVGQELSLDDFDGAFNAENAALTKGGNLIWFNEEQPSCTSEDVFECIEGRGETTEEGDKKNKRVTTIRDALLGSIKQGGIRANLPFLDFGALELKDFTFKTLALRPEAEVTIQFFGAEYATAEKKAGQLDIPPFVLETPQGRQYPVSTDGNLIEFDPPVVLKANQVVLFTVYFSPLTDGVYAAWLNFQGREPLFRIPMIGTAPVKSHPTLHLETITDHVKLDWRGSGHVPCEFDIGSHVHAPKTLAQLSFMDQLTTWLGVNGDVIGRGAPLSINCTLGLNQTISQVGRDNMGGVATVTSTYHVAPYDQAPGAYVKFFAALDDVNATLLGRPGPAAHPNMAIMADVSKVDNPPAQFLGIDSAHVVQMKFTVREHAAGQALGVVGGSTRAIVVDGKAFEEGDAVEAGANVDIRVLVEYGGQYPIIVTKGSAKEAVPYGLLDMYHDQGVEGPNLHSIVPAEGSYKGGNVVTLSGIAINHVDVSVFVGGKRVLDELIMSRHDEQLVLQMPPAEVAEAKVDIQVQQPGVKPGAAPQLSNTLQYRYLSKDNRFVPVDFTLKSQAIEAGIVRLRYCFGRVFFTTHHEKGLVYEAKLNDDYTLGPRTPIVTLGGKDAMIVDEKLDAPLQPTSVLGIQCDPWGTDADFDVYFSLSYTFWRESQGDDVTTYMPFVGGVVKLNSKDNFGKLTWVVRNLPVSAFDHAVNQVDFLHDRRLLITVGGQTNAGYPSDKYGGMWESPLSAAILAAPVTKPGFNGDINYQFLPEAETLASHPWYESRGTPLPADDKLVTNQRWGDWLKKTDEDDVSIYAAGLRNPFDVVVTPSELVYAQDNGSNDGFGGSIAGSDDATGFPRLSPDSRASGGSEVQMGDELNLIDERTWYGHPNLARYRADPAAKQYETTWLSQKIVMPREYYQPPVTTKTSPAQSLMYYRADTFGKAARGDIFWGLYKPSQPTGIVHVLMGSDGKQFQGQQLLQDDGEGQPRQLDIKDFPGGAICGVTFKRRSEFKCYIPNDENANSGETVLYQVDPFRAPVTRRGDTSFMISGANFEGTKDSVKVFFGPVEAVVTGVTKTRIRGLIPTLEKSGPTDVRVEFPGWDLPLVLQGEYHFMALKDDPAIHSAANCISVEGQKCTHEEAEA